jgi:Protein of unknown function (DUF3969)
MTPSLVLSNDSPIESEILFLSLLLGVLDLVSIDRNSLDFFGDKLFNPYCIDVLEVMNFNEATIRILSKTLFLEDYESLKFSEEKFQDAIQLLRIEILERLRSFPVRYTQSSKWLAVENP